MDKKIYGSGDYEIELHYYGYGEWNTCIYKCKSFKGAYRRARLIQKQYKGALYFFHLYDHKQGKMRWIYNSETPTMRWCNILHLREGRFDLIA